MRQPRKDYVSFSLEACRDAEDKNILTGGVKEKTLFTAF